MTKAMTITVENGSGVTVYFSVKPSGSIEKFLEDLEWVVSPECVVEMANDGAWEIV